MVTKTCKFQHKNGYNSGCIRHSPDTSAPGRGHSESAHLRVSDKFAQTDPVAMVTKNREFKQFDTRKYVSGPPGIPVREFPGIPGNPPSQEFPREFPGIAEFSAGICVNFRNLLI